MMSAFVSSSEQQFDSASVPFLAAAWQLSQTETRQAVIAGDPQSDAGRSLARGVFRNFHPDLVVLYSRDAHLFSGEAASALTAMQPIEGTALYLCENFVCREPVTSPEEVERLLAPLPDIEHKRKDGDAR
jgi:uncharacterized protein